MDEPAPTPQDRGGDSQASALESAIAILKAGLRPDGTYEGVSEWDLRDHQWSVLEKWCGVTGLIVPRSLVPAVPGGAEHDVRFEEETQSWLKFTKPNCAGFDVEVAEASVIMVPATPLQYLERWYIGNRRLGDAVEFLGMQTEAASRRLIIRQPDVPGDPPTWREVHEFFEDRLGLAELNTPNLLGGYTATGFFYGRLGIFDVRPANCVKICEGLIMPIDVIPQYFNRGGADTLARHVVRGSRRDEKVG